MALIANDILLKYLSPSLFRVKKTNDIGVMTEPMPPTIVYSHNSGPSFPDLPGTELKFRYGPAENYTYVEIVFDDGVDTAAEAIVQINATAPDAVAYLSVGGVIALEDPANMSMDILIGNEVLGFLEDHDIKAFIKIMAPTIQETREKIKALPNIMDIDEAPLEYLKQIGLLLNYKWKDSVDRDPQTKLIKQLPFIYRFKGTIPSIERIVRTYGGEAEVFEPYPYLSRYEDDEVDGYRAFRTSGTRPFFGTGETFLGAGPDFIPSFRDTTNSPFVAEDVYRTLYIPDLPGPINGFWIGKVVSASEVQLPSAIDVVGESGLNYVIQDPPRIHHVLENRIYWHEGVYDIFADIPSSDYREDVFAITHPAGRIVYFTFRPEIPVIDADADLDVIFDLTAIYDLFIPYGYPCGMSWDHEGEIEGDGDIGVDGCQIIFGFDVVSDLSLTAVARHRLGWSNVLHFDDVSTKPIYFTQLYKHGVPFNTVELLPDGHTWLNLFEPDAAIDDFTDVQSDAHVIVQGYSPEYIDGGGGAFFGVVGYIPIGSEVLLVNLGGTPDYDTDGFTGGTNYVKDVDWEQDGGAVNWLIATPAGDDEILVFYQYDPYELVEW